ncbi:unnamed protein product, partial [Ectocarpus sp. 12 AP-2014]
VSFFFFSSPTYARWAHVSASRLVDVCSIVIAACIRIEPRLVSYLFFKSWEHFLCVRLCVSTPPTRPAEVYENPMHDRWTSVSLWEACMYPEPCRRVDCFCR